MHRPTWFANYAILLTGFGCSTVAPNHTSAPDTRPDQPDATAPADTGAAAGGAASAQAVGGGPSRPEDPTIPEASAGAPAMPEASAGAPPKDSGGSAPGVGLSAKYPRDKGMAGDPAVLFHSDFEDGFAGWTNHTQDTALIDVDSGALANGGSRYLRASVSRTQLVANQYISANAQFTFPTRVPLAYWRFYTRFVGNSAVPHHWVRMGAGNASYESDGLANTKPAGDQGYWFDLDAHDDGQLSFYAYWYKMHSGRCNDGSVTPGCAGDQGTTYYYGNNFTPAGQNPFPRDKWVCIEMMAKSNAVGQSDGELALWIDDALVGEYKPGAPHGRWLRDNFYSWGPYYEDAGGFEGFDFRSSSDVLVKRITLDAYYEKGSLDARIAGGLVAPETQTILYDDVVVATTRVGCKSP